MLNQYFYHGLIRKYVAVFGTLFNNISIKRRDSSQNIVEVIKVPLSYAPKQKFLTRITTDPNLDKKVGIQLPRIGFEISGMTYDSQRKLNNLGVRSNTYNDNLGTVYNPVPYNIDFEMFVFVKNADDGTQIIEQILPFFKPEFTPTINALPTMGIKFDVPIILNSINVEDTYEGNFEQRRSIIWTLSFTMKASLYPNIKGIGFGDGSDDQPLKLIRSTITNFHLLEGDQLATIPQRILLETTTTFDRDFVLLEDDEKLLNEDNTSAIGISPVVSSVKDSVSTLIEGYGDNMNIDTVIDFYVEGRDYDPVTGNYN